MEHCFTVFIDESGDEGFKFRDPPEKGSSDWFVVSAVVTFSNQQGDLINTGEKIRERLGRPKKWNIHFKDMNHSQRVYAITEMVKAQIRVCTVAIDKRQVRDIETFTAEPFRLYFYALRLLLERVSWICRDTARKNSCPKCLSKIIFEHRKKLSHQDLVDYFMHLRNIDSRDSWIARNQADIRIHWPAIDDNHLVSAQKHQFTGLQLADLAASGVRSGLEIDRYGLTEHRYGKLLAPTTYSRSGNFLSYGMKFFPSAPDETNEFMHWIYKHFRG